MPRLPEHFTRMLLADLEQLKTRLPAAVDQRKCELAANALVTAETDGEVVAALDRIAESVLRPADAAPFWVLAIEHRVQFGPWTGFGVAVRRARRAVKARGIGQNVYEWPAALRFAQALHAYSRHRMVDARQEFERLATLDDEYYAHLAQSYLGLISLHAGEVGEARRRLAAAGAIPMKAGGLLPLRGYSPLLLAALKSHGVEGADVDAYERLPLSGDVLRR